MREGSSSGSNSSYHADSGTVGDHAQNTAAPRPSADPGHRPPSGRGFHGSICGDSRETAPQRDPRDHRPSASRGIFMKASAFREHQRALSSRPTERRARGRGRPAGGHCASRQATCAHGSGKVGPGWQESSPVRSPHALAVRQRGAEIEGVHCQAAESFVTCGHARPAERALATGQRV